MMSEAPKRVLIFFSVLSQFYLQMLLSNQNVTGRVYSREIANILEFNMATFLFALVFSTVLLGLTLCKVVIIIG